eukprot:c6412_g1_i1.p1 GENE.c6412_g1_i1~~c6412_g1_i1.p1  ORF type:complete len:379 (-),score=58.96 c6412_g1_i1:14-1105(-)
MTNAKLQQPALSDGDVKPKPEKILSKGTEQAILVAYRSFGLGVWGSTLRFIGMPLEKVALEANSGRVKHIPGGPSELSQAIRQVAQRGWADPWKVVTTRSMTAWFVQYGLMGLAFQMLDLGISRALNVPPQIFGRRIFDKENLEAMDRSRDSPTKQTVLLIFKSITAPFLASVAESMVANKAEVTRYLGPATFKALQARRVDKSILGRIYGACGPAFAPNVARNFIMSSTSFVITPNLFARLPEEYRTPRNLLLFGLALNMGPANGLAITMQSLWGRSLDHINQSPTARSSYRQVISTSLEQSGYRAFFTPTKLFTRVLMNTPAQGTIPWFANVLLPKWEGKVVQIAETILRVIGGGTVKHVN